LRGYTAEEAMAQTMEQIMTPESLQIFARVLEEEMKLEASGTADPGRSRIMELEEYRKDGSTVWVESILSYIRDKAQKPVGIISLSRDITERKLAEEQIKQNLQEKETLLSELYHRTNNNMHQIQSMMTLQASRNPDTPLKEFVHLIRQRINVIALVYRKLYKAQDLSRINLAEYLTDLANMVFNSHPFTQERIALKLELQSIPAVFDIAVPVGLVVQELLTNALKHAFPNDRTGELRIRLSRAEANVIELQIADNGIGYPGGFDTKSLSGFGLQLVFLLIENQMHGTISTEHRDGTSYLIRFRDDLYKERV
jgi:PAS domain S-box-containing protein